MPRVTVFSTASCPICVKAKNLLSKWNIDFSEIYIDSDERALKTFREATHDARTVPQILIDDILIGGFSELTELHMDGELNQLMERD